MRFASLVVDGGEGWGIIDEDEIRVLGSSSFGIWPTLASAIAEGLVHRLPQEIAATPTLLSLPLDEVVFLPVIPGPKKILCVGLNYETHRVETGRAAASYPAIFTRFADSQIGHGRSLEIPRESKRLDFEGELAVIIGRSGRRIPAERAMDHVAGFSCYNDASVRDWQGHNIQFTPGKNWPFTGALGPWMITPDEFGAIDGKRLQTRVNDEVMQSAPLTDMIFSVDEIIAYCSTFTELSPGDVIATGTPGGVGAKRTPPVFLKPGDRVEIEIDGVGVLENSVTESRDPAGRAPGTA